MKEDAGLIPCLVNSFCIKPAELNVMRYNPQDAEITDDGQGVLTQDKIKYNNSVGLHLSVICIANIGGTAVPIDAAITWTRESAVELQNALTRFLDDGGHYHWMLGDESVERQADVPITALIEDGIEIPDDLSGLI